MEVSRDKNYCYYIGCNHNIHSTSNSKGLDVGEINALGVSFVLSRFGLPDVRYTVNDIELDDVYCSFSIEDLIYDYVTINRDYIPLEDTIVIRDNGDSTFDIISSEVIDNIIDNESYIFDYIFDSMVLIDHKISEMFGIINDKVKPSGFVSIGISSDDAGIKLFATNKKSDFYKTHKDHLVKSSKNIYYGIVEVNYDNGEDDIYNFRDLCDFLAIQAVISDSISLSMTVYEDVSDYYRTFAYLMCVNDGGVFEISQFSAQDVLDAYSVNAITGEKIAPDQYRIYCGPNDDVICGFDLI